MVDWRYQEQKMPTKQYYEKFFKIDGKLWLQLKNGREKAELGLAKIFESNEKFKDEIDDIEGRWANDPDVS